SSPSSFTLDAATTLTTTVTTTAASMVLPIAPTSQPGNFEFLRMVLQALLALLVLLALMLAARLRRRAWALAGSGILLVALTAGFSGCAGGNGNPGVVGHVTGTPTGTYTVTVVITTKSGATRSFPLTITVH